MDQSSIINQLGIRLDIKQKQYESILRKSDHIVDANKMITI